MTVEGTLTRKVFPCVGIASYDLPSNFVFLEYTDLIVIRIDGDGNSSTFVLNSDYTVTGGDGSNGTITTTSTFSDGFLAVYRNVPAVQKYDAAVGDGFNTDTFEQQLDREILVIQQILTELARTMRFSDAYIGDASLEVPSPEANKYLRWNDLATKLENAEVSSTTIATSDVGICYSNVAAIKLASHVSGQKIQTKGYYSAGDGGNAEYLVKTAVDFGGTPDEYGDHTLANGNIAVLQHNGTINVKQFGAVGDGATEDTDAIEAMAAQGIKADWLDGTYVLDNITLPSGVDQYWFGNGAKILRKIDAITGIFITVPSPVFRMIGIEVDGNTGNANGSILIGFNPGADVTYLENVTTRNAASEGGGWGSGLYYVNIGIDNKVINCNHYDHGGNGISGLDVINLTIKGGVIEGNGGTGINLNNYDVTFTQKIVNAIVDGVVVTDNDVGISIGNVIEDNDISTAARVYGHDNPEALQCKVLNCDVESNYAYGITISGLSCECTGNTVRDNGLATNYAGGILFNGEKCILSNNYVSGNGPFGVDAGFNIQGLISNNTIANNVRYGLNIEASQENVITGNIFQNNGNGVGGMNLNVNKYGGDGVGNFIDIVTGRILIANNEFTVSGGAKGILVSSNTEYLQIINNMFYGNTNTDFIFGVMSNSVVKGNKDIIGNGQISNTAGVLTIPDCIDDGFTVDTAAVGSIKSHSIATIGNGIGYAVMTAGGSGYTSEPTVVFTGGGGSGATGLAIIVGGVIIGVRINAYGSGYTTEPAITFTGGGGSGATATGKIGAPLFTGRTHSIHFAGASSVTIAAATLRQPGSVDVVVPATGTIKFTSIFNEYRLDSKSF